MGGPAFSEFLCEIELLANNWLSRRHEYEADEFAFKLKTGEELVEGLRKVYNGYNDVDCITHLYSSHPSFAKRAKAIEILKQKIFTRAMERNSNKIAICA